MAPTAATIPIPPPVLRAQREPLRLMRYTGSNDATITIRGRPSGGRYRYGRAQPLLWVLERDVAHLARFADFEPTEQRDDPLERELAARLEALRAELQAELTPAPPVPRKPPARRPRIALSRQRYWHHLRRHCLPAWTAAQLGSRFGSEHSTDPAGAMRQLLNRFAPRHPGLATEVGCPHCETEDCPAPETDR